MLYLYTLDGRFSGCVEHALDPRGNGCGITYQNSTPIAPPAHTVRQVPIFDGGRWTVTDNYIGETVWNKTTGDPETVRDIGPLDDAVTLKQCPDKNQYSWDGMEWRIDANKILGWKRKIRDMFISESSWILERHKEELMLGLNPTLTEDDVVELLKYRNALRAWPDDFYIGKAFPTAPAFLKGDLWLRNTI